MKSAYLQITLEENSKPITAFTVPGKGMYQFKRMPFGLTNAPATFQRLMDKVITPDLKPNVFCYPEDIIIVTQNFDDHLKYFNLVLDKIKKANLAIGLNKCEFGCSEIKYLGFKVNEKGLQIEDDKIQPMLEFSIPKISNKADNKAGKLFNKYEGPYIIKKKISPTVYELKKIKGKSVGEYNMNDLKLKITNSNREK